MNERLQQLWGSEDLRPLWRKLERRLAKTSEARGRFSWADPSPAAREAITALLGLPPKPSGILHIRLELLDEAIRQSNAAPDLYQAVELLLGRPLRNSTEEKRKLRMAWQSVSLAVEALGELPPRVADYLKVIGRNGVLRRAAGDSLEQGATLLRQVVRCLAELPLPEPTPLPVFAATCLGDSHALDADRPLSSLLFQAICCMLDEPMPSGRTRPRTLWSRVNVVLDELSSTVLVLNLPAQGDGLVDRTLRAHALAGEPCRLTYRQLRLHPVQLARPTEAVFVCENPSVLSAAASSLAGRSRPLICIEGQPSHAAIRLLSQLQNAGAQLYYHGDFDRAGLQIAAQIILRYAAKPWRMAAEDYLEDVARAALSFAAEVPETAWHPRLQSVIQEHRKVVLEETCLSHLLGDLNREMPRSPPSV